MYCQVNLIHIFRILALELFLRYSNTAPHPANIHTKMNVRNAFAKNTVASTLFFSHNEGYYIGPNIF